MLSIYLKMKRPVLSGCPWTLAVMLIILICLVSPVNALAQVDERLEGEDMGGPRAPKKRRPRVSIGPVKSKRPGGLGGEVFKEHIDALAQYFKPLSGKVVSASGGSLASDLPMGSGVLPGMRFNVMRATATFAHPVTGEKVTGTESPVGMAEVVGGGAGQHASLRLIDGVASKGDMVRISSAPVTVLFYQGPDVDWDVSEEYYYWLEGSERYSVIDAASGYAGEAELLKAANEAGATVVLKISTEAVPAGQGKGAALRQRAIWASDGKELYTSVVVVDEEMLSKFKIAGEMFWPAKGKPVLELKAPFRAEMLETADLDCDGADEMVLSTGTSLSVFALDIKLRPPFGLEEPLEIKGDLRRKHVWLEAADLDGDGCDELLLSTVMEEHEARSYIYDYSGGKVRTAWEGGVFARIIDGVPYVQDFDPGGGYRGEVRKLSRTSEGWKAEATGAAPGLPDGVNIHDFGFIKAGSGLRHMLAYDSQGFLVLYNGSSGETLWRSEGSYGGALRLFRRPGSIAPEADDRVEMWHVNDRMLFNGPHVYAIYREPVSVSTPGLGFKGSGIIRITNQGPDLREDVFIRDIPRAAVSMAVSGDRMYVLRNTFSMNLLNLFRGKKIFVSKIMVYSTEGI